MTSNDLEQWTMCSKSYRMSGIESLRASIGLVVLDPNRQSNSNPIRQVWADPFIFRSDLGCQFWHMRERPPWEKVDKNINTYQEVAFCWCCLQREGRERCRGDRREAHRRIYRLKIDCSWIYNGSHWERDWNRYIFKERENIST